MDYCYIRYMPGSATCRGVRQIDFTVDHSNWWLCCVVCFVSSPSNSDVRLLEMYESSGPSVHSVPLTTRGGLALHSLAESANTFRILNAS